MPKIQFTTNGANSLIGGFAAGDLLVCGAAMARHLVEEAKCARYMSPADGVAPVNTVIPSTSVGRRKRPATGKEIQP
jgi:hypothetical protein